MNNIEALKKAKRSIIENQELLLGVRDEEEIIVQTEALLDAMINETVNYMEVEKEPEHDHQWVPDGDSFNKTTHENGCEWNNGSHHGIDKLDCMKNCEHYKVRRYTCHCGETKTITIKD